MFQVDVENDSLPISSYYPMQNVSSQNAYYRQYETCNDDWTAFSSNAFSSNAFTSSAFPGNAYPGNAFPGNAFSGSAFNRNLYASDYENSQHWQISESAYYPHFSNANMWPPLYVHNYDNYHEYRYPLPDLAPAPVSDDGAISCYDFELNNCSHPAAAGPPAEQTLSYFGSVAPAVGGGGPKPLPQGGGSPPIDPLESMFQCHLCFRPCASAGGLKRHAKFCRASSTNLENIFASLKGSSSDSLSYPAPCRTDGDISNASNDSDASKTGSYQVCHPINLSSGGNYTPYC